MSDIGRREGESGISSSSLAPLGTILLPVEKMAQVASDGPRVSHLSTSVLATTLLRQVLWVKVCLFGVMVSTNWSAPGQGVIRSHSWSQCQPCHHLSGLSAFLGLALKHNRGLDVIPRG